MQLTVNTVETNDVVEEYRDGDKYLLVKNVPFIRAQNLSGGYVPDSEIQANVSGWNVLTVNHPRNANGHPIRAHRKPETHIGTPENERYDGEYIRVDMAVNASKAYEKGGHAADIAKKIEAGEPINVSSQYVPKDLPPGEYDGAYREEVEGIEEPDSIALLPHKPGACDLNQGCGINPKMAANSEVSVGYTDDGETPEDMTMRANKQVDGIEYTGTASGDLDESEIPNDDYADHYVFDADTKSASGFPLVDADENLRAGNVASAFRFRDDAPDTEKLLGVLRTVNDEFEEPPIDPENFEDMASNSAFARVKSFLGITSDEPAESGDGTETPSMEDKEKIEYLAANSEYDRENLEAWDGTDCLTNLYENVRANEESKTEDGEETVTEESGNPNEVVMTEEELNGLINEKVEERVAANREKSEKEEVAEKIVANSAEYDDTESVMQDYPTKTALKTKQESLESSTVPASGMAANATPQGDDEDLDDLSAGVFN